MTIQAPTPPYPSVLRMAAPLVVSFVMRAAFTFVDTAYAALIGDTAVAAIGLTVPFEFLMIAVWVGLSTGLTSPLSRAMGSREGRKMGQYLKVSRFLVLWISPLFALVGAGIWIAAPRMGLEAEVASSFRIYGTTLVVGSAFTTFWSVIPDSVIKAYQDTRSTMWAGIWSNVINVVLNTFFLFVLGWGVFGIALSTVLGRIGGLIYAIVRARYHERRRKEADDEVDLGLDPRPHRTVLALAVPAALTFALMAAESAIVNATLASLAHATAALAAYSIYYRMVLFALNPIIAGGVAMLPYAARRFGVGDLAGVRRGMREVAVWSALYSVLLVGPALVWGAPLLASWLSESPLTREYVTACLRVAPLACLLGAPFLLYRPVFEAMGRGRPGLALAFVRFGLLTAPAVWLGTLAARRMGQPEIYGIVVALLALAGITSTGFWIWLRAVLTAEESRVVASAPAPADSSTG